MAQWVAVGAAAVASVGFLFLKLKSRNRILLERLSEHYALFGFIFGTIAFLAGGYHDRGYISVAWQAMVWAIASFSFLDPKRFYAQLGFGMAGWIGLIAWRGFDRVAIGEVAVLMIGCVVAAKAFNGKRNALWHWIPYEVRDSDRQSELATAREQAAHLDARCKQLSQASFEGLVFYERNRIYEINDAVTALFGYDAKDLVGKDFLELVAEPNRDQVSHAVQMGSFKPLETMGRKKSGVVFPVELSIKLLPAPDRVLRVASFRDLTELKSTQDQLRSEKALLERQYRRHEALAELEVMIDDPEQYSVLLQNLVATTCLHLPARSSAFFSVEDGGTRLQLRAGNSNSAPNEELLSLGENSPYILRGVFESKEPLMTSEMDKDPFGIRVLFPEEDIESFLAAPFLVGGQVAGILFAFSPEPKRFDADDVNFIVTLNARVASALTKVELFSELREANAKLGRQQLELQEKNKELLQARDAAEASSHAKSLFLDTMSHELRTPLNGILGMVTLMEYTELSEEQAENVRALRASGELLLKHLGDILEFSQLDGGKIGLKMLSVTPDELFQSVLAANQSKAQAKRLQLVVQPGTASNKRFDGDVERILEVLNRLVENSLKFTTTGGITLRAAQALDRRKRVVMRFDVLDTGPGIPSKLHSQLFQPFKQADGSASRKHGGLGLGLAICQRLVRLMGGEIGIQSEVGKGTMFWFSIPTQTSSGS